jgi:hypothetical protein
VPASIEPAESWRWSSLIGPRGPLNSRPSVVVCDAADHMRAITEFDRRRSDRAWNPVCSLAVGRVRTRHPNNDSHPDSRPVLSAKEDDSPS